MLKIGVIIDNGKVEEWFYRSLKRLIDSDYARIDLIINNTPKMHKKHFLYDLLRRVDKKLFSQNPDAQTQRSFDLNVQKVEIDQIKAIKEKELDLIVYGGNEIIKGEILHSAKYGVWGHHFGDYMKSRGMRDGGFWESINNIPETGITLQILDESLNGGTPLYRSWGLTQQISPNKNINFLKWLATPFLSRVVKRLDELGEERFFEEIKILKKEFDFYDYPYQKTPNDLETIIPFIKYLYKFTKRLVLKSIYFEEWFLMYNLDPKTAHDLNSYKKITSPLGIMWADPHIVEKEDKSGWYIFVEEMPYATMRGHLAVLEMDKKGNVSNSKKILDIGSHLSYPHIFKEDGKWWMIPESGASRKITLYRATNFPYEWEKEMDLMENIKSADTTLLKKDGKWWMFVNIDEDQNTLLYNELFLFSSDDFKTTKWKAHPKNPIVSNVANSRPAGKIIEHNGRLIRPSQKSSLRYGHGTYFNEIEVLNEYDYKEKEVGSIIPNWDKKIGGTHTFNQCAKLTIIDAWGLRRKF